MEQLWWANYWRENLICGTFCILWRSIVIFMRFTLAFQSKDTFDDIKFLINEHPFVGMGTLPSSFILAIGRPLFGIRGMVTDVDASRVIVYF